MPEDATALKEFPSPRDRAFGEVVLEMGLAGARAVEECLALQVRYAFAGQKVPSLPRLLVGRSVISRSQAERALARLAERASATSPALSPDREFADTSGHLPALDDGGPAPEAPQIIMPADAQEGRAGPDRSPAAPAAPGTGDQGRALPRAPHIDYSSGTGTVEIIMPVRGTDETTVKPAPAPAKAPAPPPEQVPSSQPSPGEPIRGYKLLARLVSDETGTVFKAKQVAMDRLVALKVLPAKMTADRTFVDRFLKEARDAGQLNHPNLARVHEVGRTGRYYFYSMELVEGQNLEANIKLGGRMEPPRALQVTMELCKAIEHMDGKKLLHGEISPQAVVITGEGAVKLLLAGLGRARAESTRFLVGDRFHYVAPERALSEGFDVRADIYSAGAVLYYALTGQHPYTGANPNEVLGQHFSAPVPDPKEVLPNLAADVARVTTKAMAKNRTERFGGPGEMMAALEAALAAAKPRRVHGTRKGTRMTTTGTTSAVRLPRRRRRRRRR